MIHSIWDLEAPWMLPLCGIGFIVLPALQLWKHFRNAVISPTTKQVCPCLGVTPVWCTNEERAFRTGRRTRSSQTDNRLQITFTCHGWRPHRKALNSRLGKYNGPESWILCWWSLFKIALKKPRKKTLSAGSTVGDEWKAAAAVAEAEGTG